MFIAFYGYWIYLLYLKSRDVRGSRNALFDDIEDGGIRASSSYSSHEIDEHENERAMDGLQDRVLMLKRVSFVLTHFVNMYENKNIDV